MTIPVTVNIYGKEYYNSPENDMKWSVRLLILKFRYGNSQD